MPMPIHDIHDVIEKFNCKSDLRQTGKFYIDETILNNCGLPIKIEAGFYSSSLISYFIDTPNIPTSQIIYKIVTKRALKPDTFRSFIKYIFDKFPEKEAKLMANSFISELGRKYYRINHGFTCRLRHCYVLLDIRAYLSLTPLIDRRLFSITNIV